MKIRCFRMGWLIPALGTGLVAGFVVAATIYHELQRQADMDEAFMPTLDRLCRDHKLSLVLKTLHDGRVDEATEHLDLLLCWDILRADAELASAEPRTRAWAEDILRVIAQSRPKLARVADAASTLESGGAREEAERVLERALTADQPREETERLRRDGGRLQPGLARGSTEAGAVAQSSDSPSPRLYVRAYKVNVGGVLQQMRSSIAATQGTPNCEIVRKFMRDKGVETESPTTLFLDEAKGMLVAATSITNHDAIEWLLSKLSDASDRNAAQEVQEGKLLFETGRLDEAGAKLKESHGPNPQN